jgi:hypothetical protein
MSARALLEELRERGIRLKVDGLMLRVDAPTEADTVELRTTLRAHKRALIRLRASCAHAPAEANRRGLVIRWSREPGWISLHDPTTGEWHEVAASGCPPWILEDAKARRRFGGGRG